MLNDKYQIKNLHGRHWWSQIKCVHEGNVSAVFDFRGVAEPSYAVFLSRVFSCTLKLQLKSTKANVNNAQYLQ